MESYTISLPSESPSLQTLVDFMRKVAARPVEEDGSFEEVESQLREHIAAVEADLLGRLLLRYDMDVDRIEYQGERYRRKLRAEKEYTSLAGTTKVERTIFVPESGPGRAICPMELRAGIVEGTWTPRAAKAMAETVASVSSREAESLIASFGGMRPSASSLDRLPKKLSAVWEKSRVQHEAELRCLEPVPQDAVTVAVSLDGVQVPMRDGERSEKRSRDDKRPQGPAGYKEVGCGTISYYDLEGERLKTTKYARMPEKNKRQLKEQLLAELRSLCVSCPGLGLVFLSDGAPDHWTFFEEIKQSLDLENATEEEGVWAAVDAFHVLEHLKKALDAYHGEGSTRSKATFEELRVRLLEEPNGPDVILRALRHRRNKSRGGTGKTIDGVIRYIEKHKHLMRYAELREHNLPIGSGVVEAACKTLASERMKRSGMSWRVEGGQAVLTLRSLIQSGRWQSAWEMLAGEYRQDLRPVKSAA